MAVVSILIIVGLVQYVIGSFVSLGLIQYNLDLIDGKDVEFGQIFSKASMFGKAFWLRLRMGIFTFLWTLLLIIPGIIKSYAYSMSGFILAENPEMTAKEAMQVSEKMMAGNKWRLFCLQFSFIGWRSVRVKSARSKIQDPDHTACRSDQTLLFPHMGYPAGSIHRCRFPYRSR